MNNTASFEKLVDDLEIAVLAFPHTGGIEKCTERKQALLRAFQSLESSEAVFRGLVESSKPLLYQAIKDSRLVVALTEVCNRLQKQIELLEAKP